MSGSLWYLRTRTWWLSDPWPDNQSGHALFSIPLWPLLGETGGRRGPIRFIGCSCQTQAFVWLSRLYASKSSCDKQLPIRNRSTSTTRRHAPYLFIVCQDYVLRTSIDKIRENGFKLTKKRSRRYPAKTITDADYADDIAILANIPKQAETLQHSFERKNRLERNKSLKIRNVNLFVEVDYKKDAENWIKMPEMELYEAGSYP